MLDWEITTEKLPPHPGTDTTAHAYFPPLGIATGRSQTQGSPGYWIAMSFTKKQRKIFETQRTESGLCPETACVLRMQNILCKYSHALKTTFGSTTSHSYNSAPIRWNHPMI